ncbi:MAG: glycosyltransferase family 4 protein [Flavobacteriales bacterium]|nr:glycosyltransferase family 4 protein [Flavobacteriales bacterium]
MSGKPRLVYCTTIMASFARHDVALLNERYEVVSFVFSSKRKWATPFELLRQAFFLLRHLPGAAVSVTQFGGFHSFLPVVLGRIFAVPSLIVLGGFDCASFPSFRYGAMHRFPMGAMTRASMRWASHLVPCSTNLVRSEQHFSVDQRDPLQQGYQAFDPKVITPCTVIPYGYDPERFRPMGGRVAGSFLTVAQMNASNFTRKGVDLLFALADRFPDHHFTLVGNTPAMRYERVPPNVDLIGFVPYEELPAVYSRHTFYLQLSVWEGFPSAPCEAMLCGCVPIVSRVAALPDIVGDQGFYLEHRSVDELVSLVQQALHTDMAPLSKGARERIAELYPKAIRRQLLDLVSGVAKG